MRFFAILLAAGLSERFGCENKLLAPFRGKPLARHAVDLALGFACFEQIFLVYSDERVAALADGSRITAIFNQSPEKGPGESARLGVAAAGGLGNDPAFYLFLPCDKPLLNAESVSLLLAAARPGFIAEAGKNGSPCLFSASFRDEILSLKPGEQPRLIKRRHPQSVITVDAAEPAILEDVNTPEDLIRLEKLNSRR